MPAGLVVLILALTLGIQPVTSDLYLPALPALSASFAAPMWQAQYTLSAMLLAFGCSQLIWGPLSDRFGRRPVLLTGLLAYTLAALASTQAPSMLWLIVWRALQGAAMGGGCGLAAVCDWVLADHTASFGTPELSLGLPPAQIAPFLQRRLGTSRSMQLMVQTQRLNALQAFEHG